MQRTFYIKTYGCQMNEYDSAKIADVLAAGGLEATADPEQADLLLLNTCSIREKAHEKVFPNWAFGGSGRSGARSWCWGWAAAWPVPKARPCVNVRPMST